MTKCNRNKEAEEEYIDLILILKSSYIEAVVFLGPIKNA
jgi:hypothetical protein